MRELIGSALDLMRGVDALARETPAGLFGAVRALPLAPELRRDCGRILRSCQAQVRDVLAAFVLLGGRLVAVLQPKAAAHQARACARAPAVTPFSEIAENVQQHLRKCRSVARARRQLASTDVVLLVNFVQAQPGLRAARESWTPLCAPRLSARGFVHAHIAFVDGARRRRRRG